MGTSLASQTFADPLPLRGGRKGLDKCYSPCRSIPPDSGGTYKMCITYDWVWFTRYHFNGYVSVSLRHISSQLNSTGTKRAIALVQTLSFPRVAVRGRQRSGLRD